MGLKFPLSIEKKCTNGCAPVYKLYPPPFTVPPAPSLSPSISLFCRNLASSNSQLEREPLRRKGNRLRQRGRGGEEKECFLHILTVSFTTLLPLSTFKHISYVFALSPRCWNLSKVHSLSSCRLIAEDQESLECRYICGGAEPFDLLSFI